jgi:multicomponent Na+:H+ antiporter subunit G
VIEVLVTVCVALAAVMLFTGVVGILVADDVFDRLHFTGPASIFAPILIAIAVAADFGPFSQAGLKAILVALLIICLDPVLVHATARAARIRDRGVLDYRDTVDPDSQEAAG